MLNLDKHKSDLIQQAEQLRVDAKELREQIAFLQSYARRLEEMVRTGKEPL
jgi:predicted nuclease with TOPRIM domain